MAQVGGTLFLRRNGQLLRAVGDFTYNAGRVLREAVVGPSGVNGHTSTEQAPKIEGAVTVTPDLDVDALLAGENDTITLQLGGGRTFTLREAFFAGDGNIDTATGKLNAKWVGTSGELV